MSKVVILGDGVASLCFAYHYLMDVQNTVYVISPHPFFNIQKVGTKFLHTHESLPFASLLRNFMKVEEQILGGGVVVCNQGFSTNFDWSVLINDETLRRDITELYAESTGRVWTPDIMNNLLSTEQLPRCMRYPTYNAIIDFIQHKVQSSIGCVFKVGTVDFIMEDSREITLNDGTIINYDILINTIPLWVFLNLLSSNLLTPDKALHKPQFIFSEPRYCSQSRIMSNEMSMTYYAGPDVKKLYGLPLKRKSILIDQHIMEFFEKPDDLDNLQKLPPNIKGLTPEDDKKVNDYLNTRDIHLLGRYAQMRSKMMLTDIIDESYKLVENL